MNKNADDSVWADMGAFAVALSSWGLKQNRLAVLT